MSIRHMEMLRQIRPLLIFMVEHHGEILSGVRPRSDTVMSTTSEDEMDGCFPILSVSDEIMHPSSPIKQLPQLHIPKLNLLEKHDTTDAVTVASPRLAVQSWEWKVLESLIIARINVFIKRGIGSRWDSEDYGADENVCECYIIPY